MNSFILLLLDAKDGLILVGNNLHLVSIHGNNFAVTPETCLHINYLTKITNALALEYFILHHLSYIAKFSKCKQHSTREFDIVIKLCNKSLKIIKE